MQSAPINTLFILALLQFTVTQAVADHIGSVSSPNGDIVVDVVLSNEGQPTFDVSYRGNTIANGELGLNLLEGGLLAKGLQVTGVLRCDRNETYTVPVGKTSMARDHSRRLTIHLQESTAPKRLLDVEFHVADDGAAFRYLIPEQETIKSVTLLDEISQLTFPGIARAKMLPLKNYTTPYEEYYVSRGVSEVKASELIGLPMLLQLDGDGQQVWMAVTESNLNEYAGMYLSGVEARPGTLASKLSPLPGRTDGAKVLAQKSLTSPWRLLMVANDPGRFIESDLIFNLNEPSRIADSSWIKPGRTTFPWWNGYILEGVGFKPGLNTATHKHYIDFCSEHGIEYHSIDGTNDQAWYGGPIAPIGPTDVTKAIPEIDMPELLHYAKEKGVRLRLWMHWLALKPQLDEALATYEKWGIEGIMIDFMDRDDQEMVEFYHEVSEKAAKHHLTVNWHGAYKPTGMERTWPNVLNYEAALNQEYNKWSQVGTPPKHNLDVAFVRAIAGPVDYHQGGMRSVMPAKLKVSNPSPQVQGTRGHQLAMYVIFENHLPMLADYPEAFQGQGGLEFLTAVPANWDETRVLKAELDRVLTVARRRGNVWYLGGMTGDRPASVDLPLSFLGDGDFAAEVLLDASGDDPTKIEKRWIDVDASAFLTIEIPVGGGFVATIHQK